MEEMRVYIANLGKYNEGELVGAWFEPPIDMDEVRERIGLNDQYEEYAIHDFELPFEIEEYTPIEEINRLCEMVEDLPDYIRDNMGSLLSYYSGVADFASTRTILSCGVVVTQQPMWRSRVLDEGLISDETLRRYFDSVQYGRDLSMEGDFVGTKDGVFELIR
ncbi:MAG: antirestriction protein ArdA [Butyricicoccus sp.]